MERELSTEHFRIPELSRRVSEYIAAIEVATPESPVSLNALVEGGDIMSTLEKQLKEIDDLYARHNELFLKDGHIIPRAEFDYAGAFAATHEVLRTLKAHEAIFRAAILGLTVLQFAEAGGRTAFDPSLLIVADYNEQTLPKEIACKSGDIAMQAFEVFQNSLQGDINALPEARLGYLGCLVSTYYAFWSHISSMSSKPPGIHEKTEHLLSLFPAKVAVWDTHSSYGRVSPAAIREALYVLPMKDFEKTLKTGKATACDLYGNAKDAIPFIFEVLDVALDQGYSPRESLQIAAHNISIIGRLTERRRDGMPIETWDDDGIATLTKGTVRLEESRDWPRVVIDEIRLDKDSSNTQSQKLHEQARLLKAGTCVARNPVLLKQNGKTHQNILSFCTAMRNLVGVEPPVLRHIGSKVYVDPAALTVGYVLYATTVNYYSKG